MKSNLRTIFSIALLATMLFTVVSCSKDDDATPKTKTELLTQNTWKYSSGTSPNSDVAALLVLYTNSEIKFNTTKTYSETTAFGPETGPWELSGDETKLITDKGTSDEITYTIVKLDASNLELKSTEPNFNNVEYTLKYVKK